ncbi:hypothetical protein ACJRPK_17445, partial [Aquimarina sp. 2-A2]|uniref:hypothetical protein n=1 Tax=Aquimarina sp. 2-A2 TaxID=3382644 RepID=UPI00387F2304
MKKVLCFLVFLACFVNYSQNKLYVITDESPFDEHIAYLESERISQLRKGIFYRDYTQGVYNISSTSANVVVNVVLGYNDDPTNADCGGSCGGFSWYCTSEMLDLNKTIQIMESNENLDNSNASGCGGLFNHFSILLPIIEPTNYTICDEIEIFETYQGNTITSPHVTWQYFDNIVSNDWVDIPRFKNLFPLNKSVKEIFGDNYSNYFSGNLQLKYKISASFSTTAFYSTSRTITITNCSPKVVNVYPTKTNCSDSTDGGFVLELDRTIEATDALTFDLFIVDNDGANVLEVDPEVIAYRDEIKLIGGKYYYTWPNSLNIGRYRVQFQTNSSA